MNLTKANEDYLEAILILEQRIGKVKSVDIAKFMGVSKPGVNKAMNVLKDYGLILKDDYADVTLTESGRKQANKIYEKHLAIRNFLLKLGVSNETAESDCCKIEHVISNETFECIQNFNKRKER